MSEENTNTVDGEKKVAPSRVWIKLSDGTPSVTATFAVVAFTVVTITFVLSMIEKIGPFSIRQLDAATVSAYLIPVFVTYFGRRYTDKMNDK